MRWHVLLVLALLAARPGHAQSPVHVLLEPGFPGFEGTFDDFTPTVGPETVRLTDPINGWGGANVFFGDGDLSSFAAGRLVVEMWVEPANHSDTFTIELIDEDNNRGKWTLLASGAPAGQVQRLTARSMLTDPEETIGADLDLGRLDRWQLLGEYDSSLPFDMTFVRIVVDNAAPAPGPYRGAAPGAAWRGAAADRIDRLRKGSLRVRVRDASGHPLRLATVDAVMAQPAFAFGTAVDARRVVDPSPTHDTYRQKIVELFRRGTIENNLKWPAWEGELGPEYGRENALAAIAWLRDQGIEVRGHNLIWPGAEELPGRVALLLDETSPGHEPLLAGGAQQELRDEIAARISDAMGATRGALAAWDVVNEPRNDNDVMRALDEGNLALADWLAQARREDPAARLAINENSVLSSSGGVATNRLAALLALIDDLRAAGAPLDSIGLQSHFHAGTLTGPEQLWAILDEIASRGVDIEITEFDVETSDELLQARYTRDFLTTVFAHPAVTGVTLWGFAEDYHWKPRAALYRRDWSIKPNGQAYRDLVLGEWRTAIDGATTSWTGWTEESRVFRGDYVITASFGDAITSRPTTQGRRPRRQLVYVPILLGDYNGDGEINGADTRLHADMRGRRVPPGTGPDGDGDGFVSARDGRIGLAALERFTARRDDPPAPGDYNADGRLTIADRRCCQDLQGLVVSPGMYADGNANGVVDPGDYRVWKRALEDSLSQHAE